MGIFFLAFGLLFICGILLTITSNLSFKYSTNKTENKLAKHFYYNENTYFMIIIIAAFIAIITMIICSIIAIYTAAIKEKEYQKYALQYETLTKQLETNEENYYILASSIIEYNNEIVTQKHYATNLWVNWYYNDKIAGLELIK